jgi:hypothetical protein
MRSRMKPKGWRCSCFSDTIPIRRVKLEAKYTILLELSAYRASGSYQTDADRYSRSRYGIQLVGIECHVYECVV